jgi:transposase
MRAKSRLSFASHHRLQEGQEEIASLNSRNVVQGSVERRLAEILGAPTTCDLARDIQSKFRRAREQLLTFVAFPGAVDVTNNACERALRPAVVQRKVTNGYRAMWAAEGEAAVRTVVDTARLGPGAPPFSTILKTVAA